MVYLFSMNMFICSMLMMMQPADLGELFAEATPVIIKPKRKKQDKTYYAYNYEYRILQLYTCIVLYSCQLTCKVCAKLDLGTLKLKIT